MVPYNTAQRWVALGDPLERLMNNFMPIPESGCLIWMGATRGKYGIMRWHGVKRSIHRLMYEIHKGPILEGQFVCHSCDVTICGQPNHFFLGTHKENAQDAGRKGRLSFLKGRKQTPEVIEARFRARRMRAHAK